MQGKTLKMKRIINDYTIEQIANVLGIHRQTYSLKEQGKKEFNASEITSLKSVLKLSPEEVCDIFLN